MTDLEFSTAPLDPNPSNVPTYANKEEIYRAVGKFLRRKNKRKTAASNSHSDASTDSNSNPQEESKEQPLVVDVSALLLAQVPGGKPQEPLPSTRGGSRENRLDPPLSSTFKAAEAPDMIAKGDQKDSAPCGDAKTGKEGAEGAVQTINLEVIISTLPGNPGVREPAETEAKPVKSNPKPKAEARKLPFVVAKPKDDLLALKRDEKPAAKKEAQPLKTEPPLLSKRNSAKKAADVPESEELTLTLDIGSASRLEDDAKAPTLTLPPIPTASPRTKPEDSAQVEGKNTSRAVLVLGQPEGEGIDESHYYYVKTPAVTALLNDLKFLHRKQPSDLKFEILSNKIEGTVTKKFIPSVFETHSWFFLARSPYFKRLFKFLSDESNKLALLDGTKPFKKIIVRSPYNDDDSASAILNSYDPETFGDGDLKLVPMELDENQLSFRILPKISKKSFTEFMGYVQFGECNLESDFLIDMLKLSTLFETSELSAHIEEHILPTKLLDNMDPGSVLELYYLANKNNLESLQRKCEYYINENDSMFVSTREWREFLSRKPELVLKLFANRYQTLAP